MLIDTYPRPFGVDASPCAPDPARGMRDEPNFVASIAGAPASSSSPPLGRAADHRAAGHRPGGMERGAAAATRTRRQTPQTAPAHDVAGPAGRDRRLLRVLRRGHRRSVDRDGAGGRVRAGRARRGRVAAARGRVRGRAAGPARGRAASRRCGSRPPGSTRGSSSTARSGSSASPPRAWSPTCPRRSRRPAGRSGSTRARRPGSSVPSPAAPAAARRASRTCRWTAAAGSSSSPTARSSRPTRAAATCTGASAGSRKYARFWRPPITAWTHPATGDVPRHTSGHRAVPAGAGDHQRSHVLAFTGTSNPLPWVSDRQVGGRRKGREPCCPCSIASARSRRRGTAGG